MIDLTQDTSRFETNMAALRQRYPFIHLRLSTIVQPQSEITGSVEAGDLNLDLGHTALYTPDASTYAEAQLARFRANPSRLYMNPPEQRDPPIQQQHHIAAALYAYGRNRPVAATPAVAMDGGGFLLVYGIGLGCHLPALFDEAEIRHFILIEEHLEFFYQSLYLHDWAGIFQAINDRGQTLRFIFGSEPRNVAAQVHWHIRGQGFGLIDGSFVFRHYSSMMLDKAYEEFTESLSLLPISIGFFEDELTMLTNCGTNLIWFDYRLLDARPRVEIDLPAIIVGSGPSLDKSIEILKELRDRAIIFSCGSSLRPLLKAGIRPDFHCELENSWQAFRSVWHVTEELGYDLDGITLIASTTAHPELLPLFKQRILYFRDSVSSTGLWCPDHTGIYGTAPTCTNLALRAATLMSFKELYLFGVDMGTRDPSQHHSRAAIYYNDDRWKGVLEAEPHHRMGIELPGNFGGKAYTSTILHWARMMMGQSIEAFSFSKIFNCSDGVTIPGTTPRLPATLRVNAPAGRKQMILARLNRSMESKAKREMVPLPHLIAARASFVAYYDRMIGTIDEALAEKTPFIEFYEQMAEYLRDKGENPIQVTLRSVNVGTLMMSFQIVYYFVRRVPVEEQSAVMAAYLDALRARVIVMKGAVDEVFAKLEAAHAEDRTIYNVNGRDFAI